MTTRNAFLRQAFLGIWLAAGTAWAQSPAAAPPTNPGILRLSTTTSTENSGLLKALLPAFEQSTGLKVQVISVGTGKALELAKNGDVDVTLVHARASEDKFVLDGFGVNRRDVMYNDFVIAGPEHDPAGIRGRQDVLAALRTLPSAAHGLFRGVTTRAPTRWSKATGSRWAASLPARPTSLRALAWAKC